MNPEFQRNLWLEMTPHRLLAAPLVLLAVFGLVYMTSSGTPLVVMGKTAYWITLLVGVFWGVRSASESIISEVKEGTWDQQRLSSIEPWSMTWGKLLGAPVFTWYVSAPCLLMMVLGSSLRLGLADALVHALLLVLALVFAHAIGLLTCLQWSARNGRLGARVSLWLSLVGLLCVLPFLVVLVPAYDVGWSGELHWFGVPFSTRDFAVLSLSTFTGWAVLGCYRLMRAELEVRNRPWIWMGFVAFCMVYVAGLVSAGDVQLVAALRSLQAQAHALPRATEVLVIAHLVALVLGYTVLTVEPKDPVALKRLLLDIRHGALARASEVVPRWLCVLPLALITTFAVLVTDAAALVVCASTLMFFLRDAGIVHLLNLGVRRQRADAAAMFYLLVLYGLLPALALATPYGKYATGWLLPAMSGNLIVGVLPGALQAVAVWFVVARRWRALQR